MFKVFAEATDGRIYKQGPLIPGYFNNRKTSVINSVCTFQTKIGNQIYQQRSKIVRRNFQNIRNIF